MPWRFPPERSLALGKATAQEVPPGGEGEAEPGVGRAVPGRKEGGSNRSVS